MKKTRCALCYAVLAVCFALLLAVSVGTGSAALSPHEILRILLLREGAGTAAYNVLLKIRLPRVLAAAVMGGTLSVSGFLLPPISVRRSFPAVSSSVWQSLARCVWILLR